MRPISEKTQAVRNLLDKNRGTTWGDAKEGLIKAKLFEDNDADESYFNNVKSQYLKRLASGGKRKARRVARPRVARTATVEISLPDAVALINANGGSVTAVRGLIANLTAAVAVVEAQASALTKLAS